MVGDQADGYVLLFICLVHSPCNLADPVPYSLHGVYVKHGIHILHHHGQPL